MNDVYDVIRSFTRKWEHRCSFEVSSMKGEKLQVKVMTFRGEILATLSIPENKEDFPFYTMGAYKFKGESDHNILNDLGGLIDEIETVRHSPFTFVDFSRMRRGAEHIPAVTSYTPTDEIPKDMWKGIVRIGKLYHYKERNPEAATLWRKRVKALKKAFSAYRKNHPTLRCEFQQRLGYDPVGPMQLYFEGVQQRFRMLFSTDALTYVDEASGLTLSFREPEEAKPMVVHYLDDIGKRQAARVLLTPPRYHFDRATFFLSKSNQEKVYRALCGVYSPEEVELACAKPGGCKRVESDQFKNLSFSRILDVYLINDRNQKESLTICLTKEAFVQTMDERIDKRKYEYHTL